MTDSKTGAEKSPVYSLFRTTHIGSHGFPSSWKYMLPPGFLQLKLPAETLADCNNCPMVALGEFTNTCRCCTHFAQIPNFQLGLALKDPRTRKETQRIIGLGHALPQGIDIPPAHLKFTHEAYDNGLFGNSEALLCPFMNRSTGGCNAYEYRTVICSTFYCGHDHGEVGVYFWETMTQLVQQVEIALSQWAMGAVGMDVQAYMDRRNELANRLDTLSGTSDACWSDDARAHLFGSWFGKEESFFEACADQLMAHRDELWTIACETPLLEATAYEAAIREAGDVARRRNEIDEPASIIELWDDLQQAHSELWKLPADGTQLVLNPDVAIADNPHNTPISQLYKHKPVQLTRQPGEDETEPVVSFLSLVEATALHRFFTPQTIGPALFDHPELKALPAPKAFLAQCICNDLILPCPPK